ncbi:DNA-packaging protein [Pseudomonas sp. AP42]|uniref:DNA-packaging protein n=1 Tax=Pseudomonas sp. AP42 TaxID=1535632 RepID=UPI00084A31C1|nr:DNA-packaging protein [Pseudomonas sp. AP42]OEC55635.1 DNA-packaging protein [Pseudomonas sp. AP42]
MNGLLNLIKPATWYVGVIAAVVIGLHLNWQDGYDQGYAKALGEGETAIAKLRLEHSQEQQRIAEATAKAANQAVEDLRVQRDRGDLLATQLADVKESFRKNTDQLKGEIARVTTLYRRTLKSAPEPLPAGVFTVGFVRVWNNANGIGTSVPAQQARQAASGIATPPDGAGAADSLDSGVTQPLVLANQIRNGELHSSCRASLNRLIDWITQWK